MFYARLAHLFSLLPMFLTLVTELVDCQFCKSGLTYHNHSHSCIGVIDIKKTHEAAAEYCNKTYSGGHLVYILDKETNKFIADLLLQGIWYHIGLNDIDSNGVYKWENGQIANYTNFNANENPNSRYYYVMMYKYGWSKRYNYEYKFICQSSPEENEFFTLNGLVFVNKTLAMTAQSMLQWKCGIHGRQNHHLNLLYRHTNGTIVTLVRIFDTELNHVMYPGCNSSGVYVCRIRLNEKVLSLEGILKIECSATYCYEEDFNRNLRVDSYTGNTEGKFCVLVYPEPTSKFVYKDKLNGLVQYVSNSTYNINFSYTDEISSRGEFHIRFSNVTSSDYGRYFIYVPISQESSSRLYFNITGPPQCPNNLTSAALSDNMVSLSWSPVADEISVQKFVIVKVDRHAEVEMATVSSRNEDIMFYNLTGLSTNINYSFYLQVRIGPSVIKCKQTITNIVIKGTSSEFQDSKTSENNIALYIVPIVAVVIILVICVVIILFVRKRKQNQKNKDNFTDHKDYEYDSGTETTSAQQSSQRNAVSSNNIIDPVCSTEVAENIYNNVLEHNAQQGAKVLKPARKSGSSVKLKDKVSMATGEHQARTLPLGKTLVTWDDEKEDVNVYENTRSHTSKQVQENQENPSSEEKNQLHELDGEKNKLKKDPRTISPEGLVYVSVEINTFGQTPKIVVGNSKAADKKQTKNKKQKEIVKEVKPSYEAVEYSSLDYLATSVAATDDGVGSLADTDAKK